ncbi:MAG: hypothetical protein JWN08_2650, partial [Frankiales bacterium]|nr:hypothetical protein [Frankiales bacterium]
TPLPSAAVVAALVPAAGPSPAPVPSVAADRGASPSALPPSVPAPSAVAVTGTDDEGELASLAALAVGGAVLLGLAGGTGLYLTREHR